MKRSAIVLGLMLVGVIISRAEMRNSASQWGITWTFDQQYECGQYCTGDWWVIGPVTITDINPASKVVSGRTSNGSMINPDPDVYKQGYDSHANNAGDTYDASLNVALNIYSGSGNTLVVPVNSSLISCISLEAPDQWPQLETAAILTVVSSAPPAGAFRPPYCGNDKTSKFVKDNLDFSILKNVTIPPAAQVMNLPDIIKKFERPWIDHLRGWKNGRFAPSLNMPSYGRNFGQEIGIGALALHSDWGTGTETQKEKLYACYVQIGIDLYGGIENGLYWIAEMGIYGGRKWPILFAGIALDGKAKNATSGAMKNIGQKSGSYLYEGGYGANNLPPDYIRFQADGQTFYVKQADVDMPHDPGSWGQPAPPGKATANFTAADIGLPEWGGRHDWHPWQDTRDWYENSYRRCCTGNSRAGYILGVIFTGGKELWNHDALFDYQDRYMEIILADDNEFAGFGGYWRAMKNRYVEVMWDVYRKQYGCVWKRKNPSDLYSLGEYDCTACQYDCPGGVGRINPCSRELKGEKFIYNPVKDRIELKGTTKTSHEIRLYAGDGKVLKVVKG
jgi:hypothetical protein